MTSLTPPFLEDTPRLLLFGGKGGVGKTTCAVAAALRLAKAAPGKSFRLLSADPAHSLADSLAACRIPRNLTVLELDAKERTDAFRAAARRQLHEIVTAGTFLDSGDIDQLLDLSPPGLDELAVMLEISASLDQNAEDCLIVDTAPSGHTLRLMTMPANLRLWLEALDALLAKRRYMKRRYARQAGLEDPLELLVSGWNAAVERMESLLRDAARCRFVPVATAEAFAVHETVRLWRELQYLGVPVEDLIVNQVHRAGGCPACAREQTIENRYLRELAAISRPARLWTIELLAEEVRGERMLLEFWEHARLGAPSAEPEPPAPSGAPRIEMPAGLPSPETRLLLFSGKGGVGKTTLACATALRLAREFPSKRILLLSTDPAHSLSPCLETTVGPVPTPVSGNLAAMEIDAEVEFDRLQQEYTREVEELLRSGSGAIELAFDRAAIGKILELAPPGLDQAMAFRSVIELLARGRYDLIAADSASTGHFLRLLELPELAEQWLAAIFGLLLKYRRLLHLPRFTDQLIQLSKNLKQFRRVLADPARVAVYAVSIPTEMAFSETKDLLAACARLGVSAPALFLNRLTPPRDCPLCRALERRESRVRARFEREFPDRKPTLVYRQDEITGLNGLLRLGESLYGALDRELCHTA